MANRIAEVIQYNQVRADIEQLKAVNSGLVFDYQSKEGNKNARSHVFKLRQKKADVERVRKAAKADALEYGRQVDAVAKELTGEIEDMIDVHQQPLTEIEQREKARIDDIRANIEEMRGGAADTDGRSIEEMRDRLAEIESQAVAQDQYQEFLAEAQQVQARAIETLVRKIAEAERREAEQAELTRLRQEAEANAKRQREEQIARQAAEKARLEAEAKAKAEQEASRRREQEAVERERQALVAAREAEERAQQAEVKAREDEARRQQEAEAAEERAAAERAKNQRIRDTVVKEVAESVLYVVPELDHAIAYTLASAMFDGKVARIAVDTAIVAATNKAFA